MNIRLASWLVYNAIFTTDWYYCAFIITPLWHDGAELWSTSAGAKHSSTCCLPSFVVSQRTCHVLVNLTGITLAAFKTACLIRVGGSHFLRLSTLVCRLTSMTTYVTINLPECSGFPLHTCLLQRPWVVLLHLVPSPSLHQLCVTHCL